MSSSSAVTVTGLSAVAGDSVRHSVPLSAIDVMRSPTRQAVWPTVREFEAPGLLYLAENRRNAKAPLVVLTTLGRATLEEVLRVEVRWIADLTRGFDAHLLAQTEWVIRIVWGGRGE